MRIILTYITFLAVFLSCKERIWDNPFDPDCPKEIFTPYNFFAKQQGIAIKLSWEQQNTQISGFELYKNSNDGSWSTVSTFQSDIFSFIDNNISGGVKYGYKLIAMAGLNPSNDMVAYCIPILGATLSTNSVTSVTSTTATTGGNVTNDGGSPVTVRGICYSTSPNPDINGNKTVNGTGTGSFTSSLSNLLPNKTYYVRAYATTSFGTVYGSQVSFVTPTSLPSLTTNAVTVFTSNSANMGGIIISDGGLIITEKGICYGTSQNPTTSNNKIIITGDPETFSNTIINLAANTTYYVRAYAFSSKGTGYGNQVTFKTDNLLTDLDANEYKTVIIGDQVWMAENLKYLPTVSTDTSRTEKCYYVYAYIGNNIIEAKSKSTFVTYGVLYNWPAAMASCPKGWHLPTDGEWEKLAKYISDQKGPYSKVNVDQWRSVGKHLKSKGTVNGGDGLWADSSIEDIGTDDFGFNGLPSGSGNAIEGFQYSKYYCYWWSSTDNTTNARCRNLGWYHTYFSAMGPTKSFGISVRCVKD